MGHMNKILFVGSFIVIIFTLLLFNLAQNAFSDLFSNVISDSSNVVDLISKLISVLAKGANVLGVLMIHEPHQL